MSLTGDGRRLRHDWVWRADAPIPPTASIHGVLLGRKQTFG